MRNKQQLKISIIGIGDGVEMGALIAYRLLTSGVVASITFVGDHVDKVNHLVCDISAMFDICGGTDIAEIKGSDMVIISADKLNGTIENAKVVEEKGRIIVVNRHNITLSKDVVSVDVSSLAVNGEIAKYSIAEAVFDAVLAEIK